MVCRDWQIQNGSAEELQDTKNIYITMESFRQRQGKNDTAMRTLKRERNQNLKRVQEIDTELSELNEQAELYRQQIEHYMDMYHAYSNDHLKQATLVKHDTEKFVQQKKDLEATQEQLRREKKTAEADIINKDIEQLKNAIEEREKKTERHREEFHENQKKTMNDDAEVLYESFRFEVRKSGGRDEAKKTYNDRRVIQAVLDMGENAKDIFNDLAKNKATICFFNGETLDLLINEQLPIHPRTIKQYYETPGEPLSPNTNRRPSDFQEILKLTTQLQSFSKLDSDQKIAYQSSWEDVKNNTKLKQEEKDIEFDKLRKQYSSELPSVFRKGNSYKRGILKDHRMYTLEEVNAWKQDVDTVLANTDQPLFEYMTPAEVFRLKTVMDFNGTPVTSHKNKGFKIAKMAAAVRLAKDLNLHGNIFGTADCIEIIDNYVGDVADSLKREDATLRDKYGINANTESILVSNALHKKLREEYGITDDTWQYKTAKAWKLEHTKRLGQINSISGYDSMVTKLRIDMQEVEDFCRGAPHQFENTLSATYHFRKHLSGALVQRYGKGAEKNPEINRYQQLETYFKKVPNALFADNRPFSFSQNVLKISSTWTTTLKTLEPLEILETHETRYFGVKSQPYVPYTEHFVNTAGSVSTHFNLE